MAPALLLAGVGAILLVTSGGHLYSPDEEVMFRTTESLVTRGSLAIAPMPMGFSTQTGRSGNEYGQYGIGNSLFAAPFHLAGSGLAARGAGDSIAGVLRTDTAVNDRRYVYPEPADYARRFAVAHANIAVTLLQVWVLFLFAQALTGHTVGAVVVGLTYALGTQAWPHAKTFFSEPLATLCLTAGAYLIWTGLHQGRLRRLWWAGIFLGFSLLTRLDSVVALPGLAVMFYVLLKSLESPASEEPENAATPPRLSTVKAHLAIAIPLFITGFILAGLNLWRFGALTSTGYEDQAEGFHFSANLLESVPGFLVSPGRSLLFHSPPVLLGLIGFGALFRRDRALGLGVLVAFLCTFFFHAKWQNWSGGWDWGPRHIFSLIAWSMIPLAALMTAQASALVRIPTILLLCIGIAVQMLAISQNPLEFYQVYYAEGRYAIIALQEGEPPPGGNDSVWSVRWSAWNGYPRLWRNGVHDLFWLRHQRMNHPLEVEYSQRDFLRDSQEMPE
jgi:hypothetical protein